MFETLALILPHEAFDGPMQMALDEVLLKQVSHPTLRIYQWAKPSVSFGYFQKLAEVRAAHPSLPLVRRWTGGGIVEHGSDLTFSLMIPSGDAMTQISAVFFYSRLHKTIAKVIGEFFQSEIKLAGDEEIITGSFCFSSPARDDLLFDGRKILGGAQRRNAGALLYQGSLQGGSEFSAGENLFESLAASLGHQIYRVAFEESLLKSAATLAQTRYRSDGWYARR